MRLFQNRHKINTSIDQQLKIDTNTYFKIVNADIKRKNISDLNYKPLYQMEHSFDTAFVTSSHRSPLKSKTATTALRPKQNLFDEKERKKRMEEIHTLKTNIQDYLHHLSSYSDQLITKALQNLSLPQSSLKINLIDLPRGASQEQILSQISFLQKSLMKLNSIAKQVKKVGRYRSSLVPKRVERESKISCIQHDLDFKQLSRSLQKSKTLKQKSFNHIKLLYQKQLGQQLRRRQRQQQMMIRQQKTKQILKQNNISKLNDKKKKQEDMKQKRRIFYENIHNKQMQKMKKISDNQNGIVQKKDKQYQENQLQIVSKIRNTQSNKLFTKILNFNKNVQDNKRYLQEQERQRLEMLESSLEERHTTKLFFRQTERAHKTAKSSQDNSIRQVLERKRQHDMNKQAYYLSTLMNKMKLDQNQIKNNKDIKQKQKSSGHQTQNILSLPSVKFTIKNQTKNQSDRILKKTKILQQISENIHQRNQRNRDLIQKNKIMKRIEQEERIQTLNHTYHNQKIKSSELSQQKRKKQNRHIYNNFKTRCRQDHLRQQLFKILQKPKSKELESTLNYIDSGRCRMFQSKE